MHPALPVSVLFQPAKAAMALVWFCVAECVCTGTQVHGTLPPKAACGSAAVAIHRGVVHYALRSAASMLNVANDAGRRCLLQWPCDTEFEVY